LPTFGTHFLLLFSALKGIREIRDDTTIQDKSFFLSHHHHQSACMHQTSVGKFFERINFLSNVLPSIFLPQAGRVQNSWQARRRMCY